MKKKLRFLGVVLLAWALMIGFTVIAIASAVSGWENEYIGISHNDTTTANWNAQTNTLTGSVEGYIDFGGCDPESKSRTSIVTIKNNKSETLGVRFTVKALSLNGGSVTLSSGAVSNSVTEKDQVFEMDISSSGSMTITVVSPTGNSTTSLSLEITVLSNDIYETIIRAGENGTVKVAGSAIPSDYRNNQIAGTAYSLTATPNSGYVFLGWIDESNNLVLSTEQTYTLTPSTDISVRAVFADTAETSTGWFLVDDQYLYNNLNDAAGRTGAKKVVLMNNATLPAGTHTIPNGVTLVIPFDAAGTNFTNLTTDYVTSSYTKPTPFRTLTMDTGATLHIADGGTLFVGSKCSSYKQNVDSRNGTPSGPYGQINMKDGSLITLGDDDGDSTGATLYAYGFITGDGSVTANAGTNVHEYFQNLGWRGGSASTDSVFEENRVFPVAQYYVQNVEVPLTYKYGSTGVVHACVTVTLLGTQVANNAFIGSSGLFKASNGTDIIKSYDPATDRVRIDINGSATMESFILSFAGGMYTFDTSKYVLPVQSNFDIYVNSGTVEVKQDLAALPGLRLYVDQNATLSVPSGKFMYIYDRDEWVGKGFAYTTGDLNPVPYTPTKTYTRTAADLVDAVLDINGTVNFAGEGYTTAGGASIISSQETGKINLINGPGSATKTYQVVDTTKYDVPIVSAKLQNKDTTYLETTGAAANSIYKNIGGYWHLGEAHTYTSEVTTPATCAKEGVTTYTCEYCPHTYTEPIDKLPHTEVIDAAVAPTCTDTGLTEGSHCSVCGEVLVAQQTVAALGHSYSAVVTAPTCTENGYTTYTCSTCGDKYVSDTVAALGHIWGENNHCKRDDRHIRTAMVGDQSYTELSTAVGAANSFGSGTVVMMGSSAENVTITGNVTLDLNGNSYTGTMTIESNGTFCGVDSSSDGYRNVYDDGNITYGTISAASLDGVSVAPYNVVGNKLYVTHYDEGKAEYSFHRVRFGVDSYTYYYKKDTGEVQDVLDFSITIKANTTGIGELVQYGARIVVTDANGNELFSNDEDSVWYANPEQVQDDQSNVIAYILKGRLTEVAGATIKVTPVVKIGDEEIANTTETIDMSALKGEVNE